jgi:hypothetical protein
LFYTNSFTLDVTSPISLLILLLILDIRYVILLAKAYRKIQFDKNANFTITERGVIDNMSILALGEIPWEEIDDIALDRYRNRNLLLIGITDPDKYLIRMRPIYKSILRGYLKKWNTPLVITDASVDFDLESLRDLLLEHSTCDIRSHDLRNS